MDAETLKDVEHLLDDQLPKIRRAYEDVIKDGCKDPVVWLFNLEREDSLGKRQAPATIRVVVFYGPDAAVFDVPQSDGNDQTGTAPN